MGGSLRVDLFSHRKASCALDASVKKREAATAEEGSHSYQFSHASLDGISVLLERSQVGVLYLQNTC